MAKVPKMLSTKDLSYISDMLNWNMILINKINYFLTDISDENLSTMLKNINEIHMKNSNELINTLKEYKK